MPSTYDLVLRGGGIKGIAFIGAIEKFEQAKHRARRLIGTSAGAIFAACYAAGYSSQEMLEVMSKRDKNKKLAFAGFMARSSLDFEEMNVGKADWEQATQAVLQLNPKKILKAILPAIPVKVLAEFLIESLILPKVDQLRKDAAKAATNKALSILLHGSACDATPFLDWMKKILKAKKIDPEITLEAFHQQISKDRGEQLSLVAADIDEQEVLVLNHHTAPKLPLVQAVRMSMSIPFVWPEVIWQEDWGRYRVVKEKKGHGIVDGGLLTNFPIRYFLDPQHSKASGVLGPPPSSKKNSPVKLLGLLLDNKLPVTVMEPRPENWSDLLPAVQTSERLFDTLLDTWDLETMREFFDEEGKTKEGVKAICRIGTRNYSALEFDLDGPRLDELVQRGRCAMTEFLKE
jgi:NTE family protein